MLAAGRLFDPYMTSLFELELELELEAPSFFIFMFLRFSFSALFFTKITVTTDYSFAEERGRQRSLTLVDRETRCRASLSALIPAVCGGRTLQVSKNETSCSALLAEPKRTSADFAPSRPPRR